MRTSRIAIAVALALAAVPEFAWAQGGAEGTTPLFTVNLGTSVWTTVVFLSLLGILWKFAWGPILEAAQTREEGIQSALDEAAERNARAAELLEQHKAQLADARRQASELIAESRAAGEQVRRDIEEKARSEGQAILDRARSEIERERDAALDTLRKESVEIAVALASRFMYEKLDQTQDRALMERYLGEMTGNGGASA